MLSLALTRAPASKQQRLQPCLGCDSESLAQRVSEEHELSHLRHSQRSPRCSPWKCIPRSRIDRNWSVIRNKRNWVGTIIRPCLQDTKARFVAGDYIFMCMSMYMHFFRSADRVGGEKTNPLLRARLLSADTMKGTSLNNCLRFPAPPGRPLTEITASLLHRPCWDQEKCAGWGGNWALATSSASVGVVQQTSEAEGWRRPPDGLLCGSALLALRRRQLGKRTGLGWLARIKEEYLTTTVVLADCRPKKKRDPVHLCEKSFIWKKY